MTRASDTPLPRHSPWRAALGVAAWIGGCLTAGAVGAVASADAAEFYGALEKPPWAPPPWVFGPVWTTLYVLMGVAAGMVWRARGWHGARPALLLFVAQLVANALWSWLFFAWRAGALAMVEIVVLTALVAATVVAFARVRGAAALLLTPYLAWVIFAATLTAEVWRRNPDLL
jgi:tryptophan-rich sensory protein